MRKRVANRAKARAKGFCELVRGELRSGFQLPVIRPDIVVIERSYVFRCHDPAPLFDTKLSRRRARKKDDLKRWASRLLLPIAVGIDWRFLLFFFSQLCRMIGFAIRREGTCSHV